MALHARECIYKIQTLSTDDLLQESYYDYVKKKNEKFNFVTKMSKGKEEMFSKEEWCQFLDKKKEELINYITKKMDYKES